MVSKQEFYFDSADGKTKIHAIKWIPKIEISGVLQIAHGMLEHIDRYDNFAQFMASHGILTAGNDHLGHGASVLTEEDRGFFGEGDGNKSVIEDMRKLRKILKEEYDELPYYILGHSMGSFLVRQYISIYDDLDGALIVGTGYQPYVAVKSGLIICKLMAVYKGWRFRSKFINTLTIGGNNKHFEPTKTKSDWLSRDEEVVDAYIKDKRIDFIFTLNAFYNMFKSMLYLYDKDYLDKIPKNLPMILLSGDRDPVGNFGRDVKKLYEGYKTKLTDVTIKLYKDDRHEILNELDKEIIYEDILNWIHEKIRKFDILPNNPTNF
jgi:alpha-beta hydrolase superfamily lysophospholipase